MSPPIVSTLEKAHRGTTQGRDRGKGNQGDRVKGTISIFDALQMKGQWESNINVWFPFMYSQIWNCAALLFPEQNYNVLSPNSYTHIYLWEIYVFPGSACLFCWSQNMWTNPGNIYIAHRLMNAGIKTEAEQFIFLSVLLYTFTMQITAKFRYTLRVHC